MRKQAWMVKNGLITADQLQRSSRMKKPASMVLLEYRKELRRRMVSLAHEKEACRVCESAMTAGNIRIIGDFTTDKIIAWLDKVAGKSPRTYNLYLSYVKSFLQWATDYQYLPANPASKIRRVVDPSATLERRALEPLEFEGLRNTTRWEDYLFCAMTGLRWTEASKITFSDLDLTNQVLTVPKGVGKTDKDKTTVIPLTDTVSEMLRARKKAGAVKVLRHPVVTGDVWKNDLKRAGIQQETDAGHAMPSSMRKCFTTWLARAGVPMDQIHRLRRDKGSLAENRYVDKAQMIGELREAVQKLEQWYCSEIGKERSLAKE